MNDIRVCKQCGQLKAANQFYGGKSRCKDCVKEYHRRRWARRNTPEREQLKADIQALVQQAISSDKIGMIIDKMRTDDLQAIRLLLKSLVIGNHDD